MAKKRSGVTLAKKRSGHRVLIDLVMELSEGLAVLPAVGAVGAVGVEGLLIWSV